MPPADGGPLRAGSRVERRTKFLGRQFSYVYEVTARDDDRSVDTRVDNPFPMRIRYQLEDGPEGTRGSIRAQGDAGGFFGIAGPLLSGMMRRNIGKDLAALKAHLEGA